MDLFGFSTLAGHFSPGWGAVAGIAGGLAFLAVVYMGLGSGMTRMNFLHILGTMMVPGDAAHRNSPEVLIEIPHLRAGVAYRGIVALTPSRSSCRRSRCTRMRYESPLMARRVARNRNRSRMAAAIMESEKISPHEAMLREEHTS